MAGSATITGTQNYVMGIGHPKTEATTEAPPAVFSTDPLTGRATGLQDPVGGVNSIFQPSSKYKFFIPGKQYVTSGSARDQSGNAADAALTTTYTDPAAWANNGYITTTAAAALSGKALVVPVAKSLIDLATQSVIFSALINKAAPAGAEIIFGNGLTTGGTYGFYISCRAGGTIRPIFYTDAGAFIGLADTTVVFADGTDHVLGMAYDALTKQVLVWRDGALTNTYNATGITGSSPSPRGFCIGTSADSGTGSSQSYDLKTNGVHLLGYTGGLPLNIGQVMQKLAGASGVAISDSEMQF